MISVLSKNKDVNIETLLRRYGYGSIDYLMSIPAKINENGETEVFTWTEKAISIKKYFLLSCLNKVHFFLIKNQNNYLLISSF